MLYILKIYPWEGKIIILTIQPAGHKYLVSISKSQADFFLLNISLRY